MWGIKDATHSFEEVARGDAGLVGQLLQCGEGMGATHGIESEVKNAVSTNARRVLQMAQQKHLESIVRIEDVVVDSNDSGIGKVQECGDRLGIGTDILGVANLEASKLLVLQCLRKMSIFDFFRKPKDDTVGLNAALHDRLDG